MINHTNYHLNEPSFTGITCTFILALFLFISPASAQEDAWSYTNTNKHPGQEVTLPPQELQEDLNPPPSSEETDPLEDINRGIFWFNEFVDMILIDPLSLMYKDLIPEFIRERIGYVLRNLSEPIVFTNNILQGDLEGARTTLGRFVVNSTVGVGGIFDVSTDLDLPYKKEDFGLTLASWGIDDGIYLVLPILGPSNMRDAFGRLGDYTIDPINWWAYCNDKAAYSYGRTATQILDAKTDNLALLENLRENSLDFYATIRTWYTERRKALTLNVADRTALDTPHPDDDDE